MEKSTHTKAYAERCAELRRVRKEAGLSQRELAAKLEVPSSWVAKVEIGERRIDLIEFNRFGEACGSDLTSAVTRLLQRTTAQPPAVPPHNLPAD